MRTITGTLTAFITDNYTTTKSLIDQVPDEALGSIGYYKSSIPGWTPIGTALITVSLDEDDVIVESLIDGLKAEKQKLLADANVKAMQIDERIQSLLALPAPSEVTA